jgi:hypothetical protein
MFTDLYVKHSRIDIAIWYNGEAPNIKDLVFIPGTEELCFVESSGRIRFYSLVTTEFRPSTLNLPTAFVRLIATPDGSCLVAFVNEGEDDPMADVEADEDTEGLKNEESAPEAREKITFMPKTSIKAYVYFNNRFNSNADKIITLPSSITADVVPSLAMVYLLNKQIHLVSAGADSAFSSIIVDITQQRHSWQFEERRKPKALEPSQGKIEIHADSPMKVIGLTSHFLSQAKVDDFIVIANYERRRIVAVVSDSELMVDRSLTSVIYSIPLDYRIEKRAGSNGLLDAYQQMFVKFPVQSCLQTQQLGSLERRLILMLSEEVSKDTVNLDVLSDSARQYMKRSFDKLRKMTSKDVKALNDFKVSVVSGAHAAAVFESCFQSIEEVSFSDWLIRAFCLIPIQIALTSQNRFLPLKDGVISSLVEQRDMNGIAEYISFGKYTNNSFLVSFFDEMFFVGWYENIFHYFHDYKVKVVSSMGEQSCGKSYMLNHLLGTAFDGSAMVS